MDSQPCLPWALGPGRVGRGTEHWAECWRPAQLQTLSSASLSLPTLKGDYHAPSQSPPCRRLNTHGCRCLGAGLFSHPNSSSVTLSSPPTFSGLGFRCCKTKKLNWRPLKAPSVSYPPCPATVALKDKWVHVHLPAEPLPDLKDGEKRERGMGDPGSHTLQQLLPSLGMGEESRPGPQISVLVIRSAYESTGSCWLREWAGVSGTHRKPGNPDRPALQGLGVLQGESSRPHAQIQRGDSSAEL